MYGLMNLMPMKGRLLVDNVGNKHARLVLIARTLEVPLMALEEKKLHIQALELEMVHLKVEGEEMTVMAWVTRMAIQKLGAI